MVEKFLRKLAFRFGYNFTLRKLPQYAVRNRALKGAQGHGAGVRGHLCQD